MFVYLIINKINGKIYVGKTKNRDLQQYWRCQKRGILNPKLTGTSKPYLYNAVRKYGWKNFEIHALVSSLQNDQDLLEWETFFIYLFRSQEPRVGYNICAGGRGTTGWHHSETSKARISAANKGKQCYPRTPENEKKRKAAFNLSVQQRLVNGSYHGKEGLEKIKNARSQQDESKRLTAFRAAEEVHKADWIRQRSDSHRGKKHKMTDSGSKGISSAMLRTNHIRWHLNRNTTNPTCRLCIEVC